MTKYNLQSSCGTVDNKTELDAIDDAAVFNWGSSWRMPTNAEWTELHEQCTWTWTTLNGVYGRKVTSKSNGNSIFLPAAGFRHGRSLKDAGIRGYYWLNSLSIWYMGDANCGDFDSNYVNSGDYNRYGRDRGFSVRPVCP